MIVVWVLLCLTINYRRLRVKPLIYHVLHLRLITAFSEPFSWFLVVGVVASGIRWSSDIRGYGWDQDILGFWRLRYVYWCHLLVSQKLLLLISCSKACTISRRPTSSSYVPLTTVTTPWSWPSPPILRLPSFKVNCLLHLQKLYCFLSAALV